MQELGELGIFYPINGFTLPAKTLERKKRTTRAKRHIAKLQIRDIFAHHLNSQDKNPKSPNVISLEIAKIIIWDN